MVPAPQVRLLTSWHYRNRPGRCRSCRRWIRFRHHRLGPGTTFPVQLRGSSQDPVSGRTSPCDRRQPHRRSSELQSQGVGDVDSADVGGAGARRPIDGRSLANRGRSWCGNMMVYAPEFDRTFTQQVSRTRRISRGPTWYRLIEAREPAKPAARNRRNDRSRPIPYTDA